MKKKDSTQSGIFNPRIFLAFALCSAGAWLAMFSFAADPSSGTLTPDSPVLSYTAGPFFTSNPTPVPELDVGPECNNPSQPCDDFALTVTLPAGYIAANPNAAVRLTMSWTDTGSTQSNYDIYIYRNPDPDCSPADCSSTTGSETPIHQSSTSRNPEVAIINPLADGTQQYTVKVVPYTASGETVNVKIEFLPGSGSAGIPFGGADPTVPGNPRYQIFNAPAGTSAESTQGEFNIGFDPKSGRIMVMNLGPIWRLTPPEILKPSLPECCEALWEDKDNPSTNTGVDPILWTDQVSGRTLVSNATAGANAVYGYSDDDGDTWIPVGIAAPNGGADHETLGSGPYPAALSALATPANQGEAVYYCSQDVVGPASCYRSDTLGASYGPSTLAYNGQGSNVPGGACGGLHGHIHVAPDGTAWLPVNQCSHLQGGVFSTDGGATWNTFQVPNAFSQPQGADPSIAIDADSTVYYAYVNNEPVPNGAPPEGHARVQVGHRNPDNTVTWTNNFDLGATHGIVNAAEIEAVGGSSGRAAVGFLGTNVVGDYQSSEFPGKWYPFIATTYDGGQTWVTVNATPNDPVQNMTGIWQQGGGNQDRNLLDFNEITVDSAGHTLYGYSDGCVTPGCISGTKPNDFVAFMRVARQSGGKSLFASNDANTDTTSALIPKAPCLSGIRFADGSHLSWKAPDNRGSDIANYQIFRGTSSGSETLLGETGGPKTTFIDTTADPGVKDYFYTVKAINSIGTGPGSNEIDLALTIPPPPESICAVPGLTELTDPSGDNHAVLGVVGPAPPGTDILALRLSQPFAPDGDIKLVFIINTDPGESPQPPGSAWYVAMKITGPDPDVNGDTSQFHYRGVRMDWNGVSPTFSVYTPGANTSGGVDGRFVASSKPADPSSTYTSPFTQVVLVAKASDLELQPGNEVVGFIVGVSQTTGGAITELYDQMPDSLAFTASATYGSFTVNGNQVCAPNNAPTAVLTAMPQKGDAPLAVHFDGSGSSDPNPGGTIANYHFDFGDGSAAVDQSAPTIDHVYSAPGQYQATLTVTDSNGLASLNTAPVPIDVEATLLNISTRGDVETGDNVLIGGVIITGTGDKTVLFRAIGPSLAAKNVPNPLQDPTLELHDHTGATIAFNDNWKDNQQAQIQNTGLAPSDDRESAILVNLSPGAYTAITRGKNNTTGIGLVEAYDLTSGTSHFGNISTRGLVGTGDNVLIGGFIAGPDSGAPTEIVLRAIGPSLQSAGIQNFLADPTLTFYDAQGNQLGFNDNWKDTQQSDIQASGLAPSDDHESAILIPQVAAGSYTAIVRGKNDTTGVGLVEIYNIP
jgi:PKD domain